MPAVRHEEHIVEPAEDRQLPEPLAHMMLEDAEHLFLQRILGHPIEMIQPGLCRPADVKGRSDVRTRPIEYILYLAPVVHVFEIEMLHRCAGDNHPVELLVAHQVEVTVKRLHMLDGRVLRGMALQFHKAHLYLEGRVREQPYQVGLGSNLYRHQVEDDDFQRTYVLCTCPRCIDNEDILFLQQVDGRQFIR